MGFGAIIATGASNQILGQDLLDCVTEVRVEQDLDETTAFAVRFQEDIRERGSLVMGEAPLQPEELVTIAVASGGGLRCLVRGPITEVKCAVELGGPGSWLEIHGLDRRVELDRRCLQRAWDGRASEAAQTILGGYDFRPDVERTTRVYGDRTATLNQRATDLQFIRRIARLNNLHFWIDYECSASASRLTVNEVAHLKPSPPRPADAPGPPPSVADIQLVPSTDLRLLVNTDAAACRNVSSFRMSMDVERPNTFTGTALNDRDGRENRTSAQDRQPPVRSGGQRLRDLARAERRICITSPGDGGELQPRAESMLTQAGWFLNAQASTTAYMLGGVLAAHDVVSVEGLDARHTGAYQVKSVTHVINAADHFQDLRLRRNSKGKG